jgi:hypothetical protein
MTNLRSDMENGLIIAATGEVYPFASREALSSSAGQELLKKYHGRPEPFWCACGADEGARRMITARQWSVTDAAGATKTKYTAVRSDIGEHPSGCFLERPNDGVETVQGRTPAIFLPFGPSSSITDRDGSIGALSEFEKRSYDSFTGYSRLVLCKGGLVAFSDKNMRDGPEPYQMPTIAETFSGFTRAIERLLFSDGRDGFAVARDLGYQLRLGIVAEPLPQMLGGLTWVNAWLWEPGTLRLNLVTIDGKALTIAAADLKIFSGSQAPPYVFIAIEQNGRILKLYLHQVFCDGLHLVLVDSGIEARYAALLLSHRQCFLKVVRKAETTLALAGLGILPGPSPWLYSPDFLIVSKSHPRLRIREVRGFAPGALKYYDDLMVRKNAYWQDVAAALHAEYREFAGYSLAPVVSIDPSDWTGVALGWEAPKMI